MRHYDEAESLYRGLLNRRRSHFGEESEAYARGLNNLFVVLLRQGKFAEAEEYVLQALDLWRRFRGDRSPDYATTEVNYAVLMDAQGHHREAIRRHRNALDIRKDHFAESSLVMARSYGALAFSLLGSRGADELAEAEPLLRLAMDIYREKEGPRNPYLLIFQRNLAATRLARGDSRTAETLALKVVELSTEVLEPGHWRVADARSVLGAALLAQGRQGEAERLLVEALPIIRRATGEASRYTREARERCGAYCAP